MQSAGCSGGGASTSSIPAAPGAAVAVVATPSTSLVTTPAPGGTGAPVPSHASPANAATALPLQAELPPSGPVPVTVSYALPETPGISALASGMRTSAYRRAEYISSSNTRITVTVTPVGGTGSSFGPTSCTSLTCTISFTANPGPTVLAFTLTDGIKTLSNFSTTQIIEPVGQNTFRLSANPVVNSVVLSLASLLVPVGTATVNTLTVNALDPDGNIITGSGNFTDAAGNPLALGLNLQNTVAGGAGNISIRGPSRITAAGQAAISIYYNGACLKSGTSTVSVTPSLPIAGAVIGTVMAFSPEPLNIIQYSAGIAGSSLEGIATGPDGNLWFTEGVNSRIGRITPSGVVTEFTAGVSAASLPDGITPGPDGNLWFTENSGNRIGRITPAGAVTEYSFGMSLGAKPDAIVSGPDGNLWFAEYGSSRIGVISTSGLIFEVVFGISLGSAPRGIALGSDGNLWFTEHTGNRIGRVTTGGSVTEFSAGITAGAGPEYITNGPDGNLWFTENTGNRIGRITPAGVITEFSTGISPGASPEGIIAAPDGNLWFTEAANRVGRITTAGTVTEFSGGITAASAPHGIGIGSDGNVWFTENAGNQVAKVVNPCP